MTQTTPHPSRTPALFRLTAQGCRLGTWFLVSDGTRVTRSQLMVAHQWTQGDLNKTEAEVLMLERQPPATRSSADRAATTRTRRQQALDTDLAQIHEDLYGPEAPPRA